MTGLYVLAGIAAGLLVIITLFALTAPLWVPTGLVTNKPGETEPSGFHLFTFVEPGQVKIIVRGDNVVRMVMATDGKKFARVGGRQGAEYWEIVNAPSNQSEDPIKDVYWLVRLWARYVYKFTGAVFTGIYPFQRVREYPLERTNIEIREAAEQVDGESNRRLVVKRDYSDHYRLRQFQRPTHVTQAETRDKIPLDLLGVIEAETHNPFKAAFGTDRWDRGMDNLVSDRINRKTRTLSLDESLTAADDETANVISDSVLQIKDDIEIFGIEIKGFRLLEADPVLSAEELKTIRAEALAIQQAKATRIDGKARADNLRDLNKANEEGGAAALETMRTERDVRQAEAVAKAGGTIFVVQGAGAHIDPMNAAILDQLKRGNA